MELQEQKKNVKEFTNQLGKLFNRKRNALIVS